MLRSRLSEIPLQMFGGWNRKYKHQSDTLGCSMTFTVYYPPAAEKGKVPVRHPNSLTPEFAALS